MVIVSGNQRVRACKELGILTINGEVVHYANDDDVIRDLIEINIRQRGIIDDSEIKQGRRFEFLQQYYGVKEGRPQKLPNNSEVTKTQVMKEIAEAKRQAKASAEHTEKAKTKAEIISELLM